MSLALSYLGKLIQTGVYPDGVETEQASSYDMVTAGDFFSTLTTLAHAGPGAPAPPPSFLQRVESMYAYGPYVSDALGCLPMNGDSSICGNGYGPDAMTYFNRTDWLYLHTNGAQGTLPPLAPTQGPSSIFPWAGQVAMRSGYDRNATWVWFDVGPYGTSGHAHRDKLSILLNSRGSVLLSDSGRFAYQGTDTSALLHRQYAGNTTAHNTLCVGGPKSAGGWWCDQEAQPATASDPVDNSTFRFTPSADQAYGSMSLWAGLTGKATHTRGVHYQRAPSAVDDSGRFTDSGSVDGDFLVVVDLVTSDQPRHVQATWHTHPNSTVLLDSSTSAVCIQGVNHVDGQQTPAQACLLPCPASDVTPGWAQASIVRGQVANTSTGTPWQGWYSQSYDDAWPSSTAVYEADVTGGATYFCWLIIPVTSGNACEGASISMLSASSTEVAVAVTTATRNMKVSVPIGQ